MNDDQRCETCGFWREHGRGVGRGTCERITHWGNSPLASVSSAHVNGGTLNVGAAFGCVEHRPRAAFGGRP